VNTNVEVIKTQPCNNWIIGTLSSAFNLFTCIWKSSGMKQQASDTSRIQESSLYCSQENVMWLLVNATLRHRHCFRNTCTHEKRLQAFTRDSNPQWHLQKQPILLAKKKGTKATRHKQNNKMEGKRFKESHGNYP
jgi:hypothetical protein